MWRDSGTGGPSATAWGNPSRPSVAQQVAQSTVGQQNQGGGGSGGGTIASQSSLLQVAVPPTLQTAGGPHVNLGQQAANNQQQQHTNQSAAVGSRNNIVSNPQHISSRSSAEMSLMLAENLAESVLNHQNTTSAQVNPSVTAKQITAAAGSNVGSGLEKSMQRLSMVSVNDGIT